MVNLVENCVSRAFELSGCRIFKPNDSSGGGESEEYARGGMLGVELVVSDSWLFNGVM